MSKRCKHIDVDFHFRLDPVRDYVIHFERCNRCGEWLSLGPASDDDERVRVEIAAAEMVTSCSAPSASWIEADETKCIDGDCDDDCDICQLFHLAAAIAAHDDTDEGGE